MKLCKVVFIVCFCCRRTVSASLRAKRANPSNKILNKFNKGGLPRCYAPCNDAVLTLNYLGVNYVSACR
jgi:hypothetical protein